MIVQFVYHGIFLTQKNISRLYLVQVIKQEGKVGCYLPLLHMTCKIDPDYSVKPRYPTLELFVIFPPKATTKIIIQQ